MKGFGWRAGLIAVVIAAAVYYLIPPEERIHLGLDLQGGIHLVLEVQSDKAVDSKLDRYFAELRNRISLEDLRTDVLRREGRRITIGLHRPEDRAALVSLMRNYPDLGLESAEGTPPGTQNE